MSRDPNGPNGHDLETHAEPAQWRFKWRSTWVHLIHKASTVRLSPLQAILALAGGILLTVVVVFWQVRDFVPLTSDEPVAVVDEYLSVVLDSGGAVRVRPQIVFEKGVLREGADRRWDAAMEALPDYLEVVSSAYRVSAWGGGTVNLAFALPEGVGNTEFDVYRWDEKAEGWFFVPVHRDLAQELLLADPVDGPVALFKVMGIRPLIGTSLNGGQRLSGTQSALINLLLVAEVQAQADGTLDLDTLSWNASQSGSYAALVVIRATDQQSLADLLGSKRHQREHVEQVLALVEDQGFDGVVLDYAPLDAGQSADFESLIDDLSAALDRQERILALRLPTPDPVETGWDTGAYDWRKLGQRADFVIVTAPGNPGEYVDGGLVAQFLAWASGEIDRVKLCLAFSSLSVDEWAGQLDPIPYEYALAPLGTVSLYLGDQASPNPEPGQALTFDLNGEATHLQQEGSLYQYEVYTGEGKHRVWIVTASSLRNRMTWISEHHIGGLVIDDLLAEGNSPGLTKAVQEFKVNLPSSLNPALALRWTVWEASGAVLLETDTALGEPLVWAAEREGEFVASADLVGESLLERGSVPFVVGDTSAAPPSPNTGFVAPSQNPAPEGLPPPVVPAGAKGNFELGGQVNHVIYHPEQMQRAGMTWVKFQLGWEPGMDPRVTWNLIEQGRQLGFKVLLSIPGQVKRPDSIKIEPYLEFLSGVAYYGPDAIEVWNEPNVAFEWPRGTIHGGNYVRLMLAPAFNAVKRVNPNIMVISAAPAPTGAFYDDGGCSLKGYGCDDWLYLQQMAEAGGADYIDCVGVHFNSGATSPSATTGHPADPGFQHYSWYYGSMVQLYAGTFGRPLCFTELGYLSGDGYGPVPDLFSWAAGTTVGQQAAWLAEAAQLGMQSGQVRLMIVWNVDFVYWGDNDPMAGYAIIRPSGGCPACDALGNVMP